MIDRRTFIHGAALAALARPLLAEARPTAARRVPRIGVLGDVSPLPWTVKTAAVEIECRWAEGQRKRLSDLAAELVALDVEVIVALGVESARAATSVTRTRPIVFVGSIDPREEDLVAGLARPDGNVTGLFVLSDAEVARRRLRSLVEAAPDLRRVAVLWNPDNPCSGLALERLMGANERAIDVRPFMSRAAEDIEQAFTAMRKEGATGLLVLQDALFSIHLRRVVELAAENRLPAVYGARSFAEAGGLMALHGDTAEVIQRTATMVARILKGAAPCTLPVEWLTQLELTMNLGTARAFGLSLPGSLLARADTLIRS